MLSALLSAVSKVLYVGGRALVTSHFHIHPITGIQTVIEDSSVVLWSFHQITPNKLFSLANASGKYDNLVSKII